MFLIFYLFSVVDVFLSRGILWLYWTLFKEGGFKFFMLVSFAENLFKFSSCSIYRTFIQFFFVPFDVTECRRSFLNYNIRCYWMLLILFSNFLCHSMLLNVATHLFKFLCHSMLLNVTISILQKVNCNLWCLLDMQNFKSKCLFYAFFFSLWEYIVNLNESLTN